MLIPAEELHHRAHRELAVQLKVPAVTLEVDVGDLHLAHLAVDSVLGRLADLEGALAVMHQLGGAAHLHLQAWHLVVYR